MRRAESGGAIRRAPPAPAAALAWALPFTGFEEKADELLDAFGVGLLPYYPLASGLLTGKYQPGKPLPAGRLQTVKMWAERFLTERSAGLQSPNLWMQIAYARYDLDRPAEAREALCKAAEMMPWPEAATMRGFSGLAANIHHKLGDIDAAIRFGRMEGTPTHVRLADRLEQRLPERRVLLDVPFVRQAHKTCAPATLTSLCQFHRHLQHKRRPFVGQVCSLSRVIGHSSLVIRE